MDKIFEGEDLEQFLRDAKRIAASYYQIKQKPLGIAGEIGELEAAKLLNLDLAAARTAGYDAIDREGRRIEIKSRVLQNGKQMSQKMGRIRNLKDWELMLLVLMGPNFEVEAIYEANREKVAEALGRTDSNARKNGALSINEFIKLGTKCWPKEMALSPI